MPYKGETKERNVMRVHFLVIVTLKNVKTILSGPNNKPQEKWFAELNMKLSSSPELPFLNI